MLCKSHAFVHLTALLCAVQTASSFALWPPSFYSNAVQPKTAWHDGQRVKFQVFQVGTDQEVFEIISSAEVSIDEQDPHRAGHGPPPPSDGPPHGPPPHDPPHHKPPHHKPPHHVGPPHEHPPHGPPHGPPHSPPHSEHPHHGRPHHGPPHHGPPHDKHPQLEFNSSLTVWQNLEGNEHFSMLGKFLTERPQIIEALNSGERNLSLLAPIDPKKKRHHWLHNRHGRSPGIYGPLKDILAAIGFSSSTNLDLDATDFGFGSSCHHHEPTFENITDAVLYHILPHALGYSDLKAAPLLETALVLPSLGDRSQRIRLFSKHGHVGINFISHVIQHDLVASNGIVHVLDHHLIPPYTIPVVLGFVPQAFGLYLALVKRAGIWDKFEEAQAVTAFVPTNRAIRKLGFRRIAHLLSPSGHEDLLELLAAHTSTQLLYTHEVDIPENGEVTLPSYLDDQPIQLKFTEKHGHRKIKVNDQAKIIFSDGLGSNGAIHVLNKVLDVVDIDAKSDCHDQDGSNFEDDVAGLVRELRKIPELKNQDLDAWIW